MSVLPESAITDLALEPMGDILASGFDSRVSLLGVIVSICALIFVLKTIPLPSAMSLALATTILPPTVPSPTVLPITTLLPTTLSPTPPPPTVSPPTALSSMAPPLPTITKAEPTRVALATSTIAPAIVTPPGAIQTQAVRDYQSAQTATAAAQTVIARSTEVVINTAQTLVAATVAAMRPTTLPQPPTLTPTPSPEKPRYRLDPTSAAGRADVTGITLFDASTGGYLPIYGEPGISSAAFSRDGTRIVISSGVGDGRTRVLRTTDILGKNAQDILRVIVTKPGVGPGEAIWSPDGKQVALYFATGIDFPGLFKMNVNNSVTTALKTDPGVGAANYRPRYWSVDDKWIVAYWLQNGQLYAFQVNGGEPKPISQIGNLEVYDERYWPWKRLIAPAKCKISDYFNCD